MVEKEGWQEAKAKSAEPKDRRYQTFEENFDEDFKEWVFGDFTNRDARNKYDDNQKARDAKVVDKQKAREAKTEKEKQLNEIRQQQKEFLKSTRAENNNRSRERNKSREI